MYASQTQPTNEPLARVDKPWGYEIIWASTEHYVGKILFVRAGHQLSLQFHRQKEETMYLESGECIIETGSSTSAMEQHRCEPGAIFHIAPGCLHRVIALTDCRLFEVSTPHLNDVVRIEDNYGRI